MAAVSSACAVLSAEGRLVVARGQDGNASSSGRRDGGVECAMRLIWASRRRMVSVRCVYSMRGSYSWFWRDCVLCVLSREDGLRDGVLDWGLWI
jgi:hypothetical protein